MADAQQGSPKQTFDELRTMVVDYAKQETVDPIKNLGKWLAFGFGGGLSIALGLILLGLGALRGLQRWSALDDGWNFAPYLILVAILGIAIALLVKAAQKTPDLTTGGSDA